MPRKAKDEEKTGKEKKAKVQTTTKNSTKKSITGTTQSNVSQSSNINVAKSQNANSKKVAKITNKATSISNASKASKPSSAPIKKGSSSKKSSKTNTKITKNEYYDLPTSYPETIVKILAQTPTILFVYWDISEKDRKKLKKQFGEDIFQNTTPYLIIKNETKNYQYEVEVNDYANSWYLHIPDSDCKYEVILIRKAKGNFNFNPNNSENNNNNNNNNSNNNSNSNNTHKIYNNSDFNNTYYSVINNCITITSSNDLQTPNDHILFEKLGRNIFFQNVKSKEVQSKDISSFAYMHNIGRIYHIYDLYKEMYKDELNGDELGTSLSSSHMSF